MKISKNSTGFDSVKLVEIQGTITTLSNGFLEISRTSLMGNGFLYPPSTSVASLCFTGGNAGN